MAAAQHQTMDGPEPITSLVEQYQREFQEQYNNIRKVIHEGSNEFKDGIAKSKHLLQEAEDDPAKRLELGIVQPLKNLTSIGIAETMLLQTFAWITIMMLFFWIGHNVFSAILNPILSILLTDVQLVALTVLVPILAHRAINSGLDVRSRFNLQIFAILHGIVTGYVFKDHHLHLPMPFIGPLFIAVAAHFLSKSTKSSRVQFLSIALLSGLLANCALGWIIAGLTFSYLLAAILQTIIALFTLQYYNEHWEQDYEKNPYVYMFGYHCATVSVQLAVLFLFGSRGT